MKKLINTILITSMLATSNFAFAQSTETKSLREQTVQRLKEDLKKERESLSALQGIQATGLGVSQSWGKHAVIVLGALSAGLAAKAYSSANAWTIAGVSTLFATIGEQAIVMIDESKLADEISNAQANVILLQKQIEDKINENNSANPTAQEVRKVQDLREELNQAKSDLDKLLNIHRTGIRTTAQAGKHLVAIGLTTSAALLTRGLANENKLGMKVAANAIAAFTLREAFVVVNDALTLKNMIEEKRAIIGALESQIESIENKTAK